jgi:hypothetical protein
MSQSPYAPPEARITDSVERIDAPREVRIAISFSWVVLTVQTLSSLWEIFKGPEASADFQFKLIWLGVTLTTTALPALFIFQASRRRNWGRIALLVWTLGVLSFWVVWPPRFGDFPWWKWGVAGTLAAMQVMTVVFLVHGRGARWYSLPNGATDAL